MKTQRTWADAACEVAWNFFRNIAIQIQEDEIYCSPERVLLNEWRISSRYRIKISEGFPAFRLAFMKWLKDNEVKA